MKMKMAREKGLDNSIGVLLEGYRYMSNRMERIHPDMFETRLLGQKVICIRGEEAARAFYDTGRFQRHGAIPARIRKSLFGNGGVQTLDDEYHHHRKQLMMQYMDRENLQNLATITREQLEYAVDNWKTMKYVELFEEMERLLCIAACQWTGVPLNRERAAAKAKDLGKLVDAFGAVGPRHWQGRFARKRTERWIMDIVQAIRQGIWTPDTATPLYGFAWHRDLSGRLLPLETAAVEVINLLRPITAIARYIIFGTLALHNFSAVREKVCEQQITMYQFVQEVRRYYPFAPFLGARVRRDFIWQDQPFKKGRLVLLDVYGTNHHPTIWKDPDIFDPERFREGDISPYQFIAQGGGKYLGGHRCAGEWATINVMETVLDFMANEVTWDMPEQELDYSMRRMPSIPKSRFVIKNVNNMRQDVDPE